MSRQPYLEHRHYTLPAPPQLSALAQSIIALEQYCDSLHTLCGEMLATLRVNVLRGSILTDPADKTHELTELIDSWHERWSMPPGANPPR